jgi:UDP-glucose 4-epimerase
MTSIDARRTTVRMNLMAKHFLVTGGAGFIGSHLCDRLLADGNRVTVLDDLSTGNYDNVASLEGQKNFRLIIDSVLHEPMVDKLVGECDAVFHLASAVGVKLIMDQPVKTIETIVLGTDMVLRYASRFRRRVLLTSTSEVYGKSEDLPFREDGDRLEGGTKRHRWAYATAKALDEFLALAHWKETRLPVICVRLFNTVGPRQSGQYGMVMPRFVQAALQGDPLTVYGDGSQSRCFCHVSDVIDGLVTLMNCPKAAGDVFNLGSQEEITILDLAHRVVRLLKSESRILFKSYEEVYGTDNFEDMQRRVPHLGRIEKTVGWTPHRSLDEIILEMGATLAGASDRVHVVV